MVYKKPVKLRVSNTKALVLPVFLLNLLLLITSQIYSHPIALTFAAILIAGAGWLILTLKFSKSNSMELTSVIFPDGTVRLESNREDIIEGVLDGQQWSTSYFAVLRMVYGDRVRKLLVCSTGQQATGDFQRLNMWLRQGLCDRNWTKQVLES